MDRHGPLPSLAHCPEKLISNIMFICSAAAPQKYILPVAYVAPALRDDSYVKYYPEDFILHVKDDYDSIPFPILCIT